MAKQKKPVHRVEMTEGKRNIIRQLLEESSGVIPNADVFWNKLITSGLSRGMSLTGSKPIRS